MKFLFALGLGLVLSAFAAFSAVQNFYVSPTGTGDYSLGSPGALSGIQAKIRTVNTNMTDNIVVNLRQGWYTLSSTLAFTQADGGTNGNKIIYQAYGTENVVISGGMQITGWSQVSGTNQWSATAPAGISNRQIYVNCVRAIRAKSPKGNAGPAGTEYVQDGSPAGVSNWRQWRSATAPSNYTYQENAFSFLDQPGEWFLDRPANKLYYIPRTGENMATAVVIAPVVVGTLVSLTGTSSNKISNIQFKGITFAHTTSSLTEYKPAQTCFTQGGSPLLVGSVALQYSNSIRFERCMFKHLGSFGLSMFNGSTNNAVVGCVFTDISGSCVALGSATDPQRTNTALRDTCDTLMNCYIHDAPVEFRDGDGLFAGYVANLIVSHNEICYTPYSAIGIGWGWGATSYQKNNILSYNNIHHFMQVLLDGGAIYHLSPSPGTRWHHNYGHDMAAPNNEDRVWYTDEGTSNVLIDSNVAEKFGPGGTWYSAWTATIHDNTIRDNYVDVDRFQNNGTNCVISNTTVVSNGAWPAAAQNIMNNSGLQSAFADVKTMACACSLLGGFTSVLPRAIGSLRQTHSQSAGPISVFSLSGKLIGTVGQTNIRNVPANGVYIIKSQSMMQKVFYNGKMIK